MDNIFQSPLWEEFKLKTGYQKSHHVDGLLVLQKNLPLGYSMLYAPMVDKSTQSTVLSTQFQNEIKKIGQQNNSIFYRLELDIPCPPENCGLSTANYIKSFEEMQPEHSLVLDLTQTEEQLLAQMKPKGRYNIKVAQKNNLVIEKTSEVGPELDIFFQLYSETAKRHKITFRSKEYFRNLLEILGKNGYASLYTIYLTALGKKTALASAIVIYSGPKAIYLFGASSEENRNLMAPYLLQFEMIRQAKAMGCLIYDFFGISPDDSPNHAWAGVTRFKKQFGGDIVQTQGSYDLIIKPLAYKLFKIAEQIRRKQ